MPTRYNCPSLEAIRLLTCQLYSRSLRCKRLSSHCLYILRCRERPKQNSIELLGEAAFRTSATLTRSFTFGQYSRRSCAGIRCCLLVCQAPIPSSIEDLPDCAIPKPAMSARSPHRRRTLLLVNEPTRACEGGMAAQSRSGMSNFLHCVA